MQEISSKRIQNVVDHFASLPSVGRKTALRLALHLLKKSGQQIDDFAEALKAMAAEVKFCKNCHNISDHAICSICNNAGRNAQQICVVENIQDVMAMEATQQFSGVYHVLGGIISPMDGIGPDELNVATLLQRVQEESTQEIIFALNSSLEGETTQFFLHRKLKDSVHKITTLARGISFGDQLEYTDEITLGRSILNRQLFENQSN
jgi:recombination protein RecR